MKAREDRADQEPDRADAAAAGPLLMKVVASLQLVQDSSENDLHEEHLHMVIRDEQLEYDRFVNEEMLRMQSVVKGAFLMQDKQRYYQDQLQQRQQEIQQKTTLIQHVEDYPKRELEVLTLQ